MGFAVTILDAAVNTLVPALLLVACCSLLPKDEVRAWVRGSLLTVAVTAGLHSISCIVIFPLRPLPQDWYFVPVANTLIATSRAETVAWGFFCVVVAIGLYRRRKRKMAQNKTPEHISEGCGRPSENAQR